MNKRTVIGTIGTGTVMGFSNTSPTPTMLCLHNHDHVMMLLADVIMTATMLTAVPSSVA